MVYVKAAHIDRSPNVRRTKKDIEKSVIWEITRRNTPDAKAIAAKSAIILFISVAEMKPLCTILSGPTRSGLSAPFRLSP